MSRPASTAAGFPLRYCARCGTRLARDNRDTTCGACQRRQAGIQMESRPPQVPADFWQADLIRDPLAERHMGHFLRAYREHPFHGRRGIPQGIMSRWLHLSQTQLSRIENGPPVNDLARLNEWARLFRIPPALLWFDTGERDGKAASIALSDRISSGCRVPGDILGVGCNSLESEPEAQVTDLSELREVFRDEAQCHSGEEIKTLRRDFLGISGAVAVGGLSGILDRELSQLHIALSRGAATEERIEYLESRADDLGVKVAEEAPMTALGPAFAVLNSVRALLEQRQLTRYQARLVAISAKLSLVVGVEAFNAGHIELALEWHKTASYAAHDVGFRYLMDIALAQQAFTPLYKGSPARALQLTASRLEDNYSPSPAVAQLWGITARAHAALGEQENFKRSIANAWECLDRSESESIAPGILSFHPANLAFYETTGAVALNDLSNSLDAAERAMTLFEDTESYDRALVGLERASALAKAGEISEACHAAKTVLIDPATYYCAPVLNYARRFSEEIQAAHSAEASEWRELLTEIERAEHSRKP